MKRLLVLVPVLLVAAACSKDGGDPNVVNCNRLTVRTGSCAAELQLSQGMGAGPGASGADVLTGIAAGSIGAECPVKQGKLENGRAVNACLAKTDCGQMAECFRALVRPSP